jgi:hypothetical protein
MKLIVPAAGSGTSMVARWCVLSVELSKPEYEPDGSGRLAGSQASPTEGAGDPWQANGVGVLETTTVVGTVVVVAGTSGVKLLGVAARPLDEHAPPRTPTAATSATARARAAERRSPEDLISA